MSNETQTMYIRFDTEIRVTLPACKECRRDPSNPCSTCKQKAIEHAARFIRGGWVHDTDVNPSYSRYSVTDVWVEY